MSRTQHKEHGVRYATDLAQYLTPPSLSAPLWEYATVAFSDGWRCLDNVRNQLNQMGAHGWELCERRESALDDTDLTLIFKRRAH